MGDGEIEEYLALVYIGVVVNLPIFLFLSTNQYLI